MCKKCLFDTQIFKNLPTVGGGHSPPLPHTPPLDRFAPSLWPPVEISWLSQRTKDAPIFWENWNIHAPPPPPRGPLMHSSGGGVEDCAQNNTSCVTGVFYGDARLSPSLTVAQNEETQCALRNLKSISLIGCPLSAKRHTCNFKHANPWYIT